MMLAIGEKACGHVSGARSGDWQLTLYCVAEEFLRNDRHSEC